MASAKVIITGDSKDAQRAVGALDRKMDEAAASSKTLLAGLGAMAAAAAAAAIKTIQLAGKMEQTEIAFESLTGSAETAEKILKELRDFAATTPFQFPGLAQSTRLLITMGMNAEQATNAMKIVADAVAAAGGGQEELQGVARALGQIQAKGKLSAEELMQLAERGIPAQQILQDQLGLTGEEVADIGNQGVTAAEGIEALLDGLTKKFEGAAKEQAKTTLGIWSTFKDNVTMTLIPLGDIFTDVFNIKETLNTTIERLQDLRGTLETIRDTIEQQGVRKAIEEFIPDDVELVIIGVAGALTGALIPAFYSLATATWSAIAPLTPFIALGTAVSTVAWEIYKNWDNVSQALVGIWDMVYTSFKNLVTRIQLATENMKLAVLTAVDFMLEKFSSLEKLPFGIGKKFKGLGDSISDSADKSKAKIKELSEQADKELKTFTEAAKNTGQGFSQFHSNVGKDVVGIIDMIAGVTEEMKNNAQEQVDVVSGSLNEQVEETKESEEEKTDKTKEEGNKRTEFHRKNAEERKKILDRIRKEQEEHLAEMQAKLEEYLAKRKSLEQEARDELFELTATELEKLKKEFEEKKAIYEKYGADTTDLEKKYQIERQQIIREQAEKQRKIDEKREKEHQRVVEKIIRQREQDQADLQAKVDAYISEKERQAEREKEIEERREREHQEVLDRIAADRQAHLDNLKQKYENYIAEREALEQKWQDKLFNMTATDLERLEHEKEEALRIAREKGADTTAIEEVFAIRKQNIIREQNEKQHEIEERRAEQHKQVVERIKQQRQDELTDLQQKVDAYVAEKERQEERDREFNEAREREHQATLNRIRSQQEQHLSDLQEKLDQYYAKQASFEQKWTNKLFEQTATREERLQREKEVALQRAEELGADKTAIIQFYANKEKAILDEQEQYYRNYGNAIDTIVGVLKDNVAAYMKNLKENTEQASKSAADAIVGFIDSVASGSKTFKEAMKDMLLSMITMLEKQVLAQKIAGIATAVAQAPVTAGASLATIPAIIAEAAGALALFETLKAGIRGLAEGGKTLTSGTVLVGEEGPELLNLPAGAQVTPLNKTTNNRAGDIYINVTGNNISSDYDIDRIGERFVKKLRMAGVTP